MEPLAACNLAEYTACALSSHFFVERRQRMEAVDPALAETVFCLLKEAEHLSHWLPSLTHPFNGLP